MSQDRPALHGTRTLHTEDSLSWSLDTVPPAYTTAITGAPLPLEVTDYNVLRNAQKRLTFALGARATHMLNTFFLADPQRQGNLTTAAMSEIWGMRGASITKVQAGTILRGVEALNAIRYEIDGGLFVVGGQSGSGHIGHLAIAPDIVFVDKRGPIDENTTW